MNTRQKPSLPLPYLVLVLVVLAASLGGYGFYLIYPRFALPDPAEFSLLLLALMAGLASLFSPCSFPLLLTILSREAEEKSGRGLRKAALAFTTGTSLFLLLLGGAVALGAGELIAGVTFTSTAGRLLRTVVGLTLAGFGWWQIRGRSLSFPWVNRLLQPLWEAQIRLKRRQSGIGFGLYGFGYILAGFG